MTTLAQSATIAPAPAGPRRYSRDDILRLGQASQPWAFLPIALQALRLAPDDLALRMLTSANFAAIGLRTPSREHIEKLPRELHADPGVRQLLGVIDALPSDEISHQELLALASRNLEALGPHAAPLARSFDAWRVSLLDWQWFRARDGNIVRRKRGEPDVFRHLADHHLAAQRFVQQHLAKPDAARASIYLEGADPPWLLQAVHRATPGASDGFQTRLVLIQSDPLELLDALAHADLTDVLAATRFVLHVGPGAGDRLRDDLAQRRALRVADPVIPLLSVRTRVSPAIDRVVAEAEVAQSAEHAALSHRVREVYLDRDAAFWSRRYAAALAPSSPEPLRILIPTTRYSTFVRHSSRDLVLAFERAGHTARLLIEPDSSSRFSSVAYLRELDEFRPDLIVLINYYRHQLDPSPIEPWLPRNIPFITWIQDDMPQLHDAQAQARLGPFDFVAGHIPDEFRRRLGLDHARVHKTPIVASSEKFHAGGVAPSLRERFECDLAFVSHHGETPRQMHARMIAESGGTPLTTRVLEAIFPSLESIAADPMSPRFLESIRALVDGVVAAHVPDAERREPIADGLQRQYAVPIVEHFLRHQTLEWAADLARSRGWRLHLYGRAWDTHPRFAEYWKGLVEHGEELRACYRCAAVHLHVSATALIHQRISECALSGGLPIARLTLGALDLARGAAIRDAICDGSPFESSDSGVTRSYATADHGSLLMHAGLRQRLGLPASSHVPATDLTPDRLAIIHRIPLAQRPDSVFVDLAQTTFRTPRELEGIVGRAIESPAWRAGLSRAMAARAAEGLTHDSLVPRFIDLVQRNLA
jgi:hypothetical protein